MEPSTLGGRLVPFGLFAALLIGGRSAAQVPQGTSPDPNRLTVRPREMATGTKTDPRGLRQLDPFKDYSVYIPESCQGQQRCPLLVYLQPEQALAWQFPEAERYGVIVLATSGQDFTNVVDSALKLVLQQYAIDPDKIAIAGISRNGLQSLELGHHNMDVFSRVCVLSAPTAGYDFSAVAESQKQNRTTEFFLSNGITESGFANSPPVLFQSARVLRQEGHPVTEVLLPRDHGHYAEETKFMWRWLHESWTTPSDRPTRPTFSSAAIPLLTGSAVARMTAFWTRFMQEPDSIRLAARRAHQKEIILPVGQQRPLIVMMDIPALAAEYPSVAAALKAAKLTALQAERYRVALFKAWTIAKAAEQGALTAALSAAEKGGTQVSDSMILVQAKAAALATASATPGVSTTEKQNITFMFAHEKELQALEATKMWTTP